MTPKERAERIVCDAMGALSGWEYVAEWIADAIREAVVAEREWCVALADGFRDQYRSEAAREDTGLVAVVSAGKAAAVAGLIEAIRKGGAR